MPGNGLGGEGRVVYRGSPDRIQRKMWRELVLKCMAEKERRKLLIILHHCIPGTGGHGELDLDDPQFFDRVIARHNFRDEDVEGRAEKRRSKTAAIDKGLAEHCGIPMFWLQRSQMDIPEGWKAKVDLNWVDAVWEVYDVSGTEDDKIQRCVSLLRMILRLRSFQVCSDRIVWD